MATFVVLILELMPLPVYTVGSTHFERLYKKEANIILEGINVFLS